MQGLGSFPVPSPFCLALGQTLRGAPVDEIARQITLVVGISAAAFIGPFIALCFLILRKRRARAQRRSPLGIDMLRGPGHTLRQQLEVANEDQLSDLFTLMVLPLLWLCVALAQGHLRGVQEMVRTAPLYVVVGVAFLAFMVRKLLKAAAHLDNLKAGFDAELAVGQELDQLMRRGAFIFHDIPAEHFNIDHVVVAGEGVFAVETKGFTKPQHIKGKAAAKVFCDGELLKFPTWTTKEPLDQADRQAAWLAKWLTGAVGSQVQVQPVLALPGWFVERSGRSVVKVYSGKELAGLLNDAGTQVLTAQDVKRIAHQIEQRCRTVAPLYTRQAR